jgi:hypothetical protein
MALTPETTRTITVVAFIILFFALSVLSFAKSGETNPITRALGNACASMVGAIIVILIAENSKLGNEL